MARITGQVVKLRECPYAKPSPITVTFIEEINDQISKVSYAGGGVIELRTQGRGLPWIEIGRPEKPLEFFAKTEDLEGLQ
jgi:hypothetical protein